MKAFRDVTPTRSQLLGHLAPRQGGSRLPGGAASHAAAQPRLPSLSPASATHPRQGPAALQGKRARQTPLLYDAGISARRFPRAALPTADESRAWLGTKAGGGGGEGGGRRKLVALPVERRRLETKAT